MLSLLINEQVLNIEKQDSLPKAKVVVNVSDYLSNSGFELLEPSLIVHAEQLTDRLLRSKRLETDMLRHTTVCFTCRSKVVSITTALFHFAVLGCSIYFPELGVNLIVMVGVLELDQHLSSVEALDLQRDFCS